MITLLSVIVKHRRRLRLLFTHALDSSAFLSTSPYTVVNIDGVATPPNVVAVYAVVGLPTGLEIALDVDLVPSAIYTVSAIGVEASDTTVTDSTASTSIRIQQPPSPPNAESTTLDSDLLLYGRDLMFDGVDYVETSNGDLARVSGTVNVQSAIIRRLNGSPLPWAPLYSPNAREFVDSVDALPLRGRLREQALRDDRVARAEASFSDPVFNVSVVLIGGHAPDPVTVTIRQ